jgi:hypothetical protein
MTRCARLTALTAALVAVLLVAGSAAAYTIYLKDGSQLIAQEKYTVRDGQAYILLPNGTRTFIRATEIDVERTDRANRTNLGSAVVLEGDAPPEAAPAPPPRRKDLGDLIHERPPATTRPAAPAPADPAAARPAARRPLDSPLAEQLATIFREHGVTGVEVVEGDAAGRPLVNATTPSEAAVFRAVAVAATALTRLREQGAALPALELSMTSPTGERAGSFLLSPEQAEGLLAGRTDVATFFVDHVRF